MSWFVQVIVSPTCTDDVPGLNAKFLIVTPVEAAARAVGAGEWRRRFGGTSAGAVLVVRAGVACWTLAYADEWRADARERSGGGVTVRPSFASPLCPWSSMTRSCTVSGPATFGVVSAT